jgi:asparagine synthetase B (glutamine-hydrolysing)
VPGLCAVVELESLGRDGGVEPPQPILDRMIGALRDSRDHQSLERLSCGPFHLAIVGYPSRCLRVARQDHVDGSSEVWYGEVYHGRSILDPAGSDDDQGPYADLDSDLSALSGCFVGIRFNPTSGHFELFNDALAFIPVCVRRTGPYLLVAPEAKALLAYDPGELTLDRRSLAFYLSLGYLPPGRTHFEQIHLLPPATVMQGRAGRSGQAETPRSRRYWVYGFPTRVEDRGREFYVDRLSQHLRESVASQVLEGQRSCICLSGGVDSRAILGIARSLSSELGAVTWGRDPGLQGSDAEVAAEVARAAGIRHRFIELDAAALPNHAGSWVWTTDGALEGLYNYPQGPEVFQALARDHDVVLRGEQCFMRWPYGVSDDGTARTAVMLYPLEWHRVYERLLRPDALRALTAASREVHEEIGASLNSVDPRDRKDEYFYAVHLHCKMNPQNYYKLNSIALRNPLIDKRILELVTTIPRHYRRGKGLFSEAIQQHLGPLEAIPNAVRSNLIPWGEVVPLEPALSRFFTETLLDAGSAFNELIDREALEAMLRAWLRGFERRPAADAKRAPRRRPGRLVRRRFVEIAKRVAYSPHTPRPIRKAMTPRNGAAPTSQYLFRLSVLALYLDQLESRGIRPTWSGSARIRREGAGIEATP